MMAVAYSFFFFFYCLGFDISCDARCMGKVQSGHVHHLLKGASSLLFLIQVSLPLMVIICLSH